MNIRILLISDIHGNFPALDAIAKILNIASFEYIINCGDSLVYAPFPNETLDWLKINKAISILGNTDKKVLKLLAGKSFKKPGKPDKRIMYSSTAEALSKSSCQQLLSFSKSKIIKLDAPFLTSPENQIKLGIFHGSPVDHNEFLFANTPDSRFYELANSTQCNIVVTGHSHTPYDKYFGSTHFINPGSVGRMFDGDPSASFAIMELTEGGIKVNHFRVPYKIEDVVTRIRKLKLPDIYAKMYKTGRKLN